jgi:hypothetical protein
MDQPAARHPWYRLHTLTWIVAAVVVGALVVMNVWGLNGFYNQTVHGWPRWFARRVVSSSTASDRNRITWPIGGDDGRKVSWFGPKELTIDVALALTIVGGAAWTVERWSRRRASKWRFGLRAVFGIVAWAASYAAIRTQLETIFESADTTIQVAIAPLALGVALAWLALIDMAGAALKRIVDRRRNES